MNEPHAPKNGFARALDEASPDTPLQELPQLVETVAHWECARCGKKKFTKPTSCGECGGSRFNRITPEERSP